MASVAVPRPASSGSMIFAGAVVFVALAAALLAAWSPLGVAIVIVFLFAGPHNWIELRYFLGRMPGRLGKLRPFFLTAFIGVILLTLASFSFPYLDRRMRWQHGHWMLAMSLWNSAFVLWLLLLIQLRARQNPRRRWGWTIPLGLALLGLAWLWPLHLNLAVLYVHPLIAFWMLDRELKRSRPGWRRSYHLALGLVLLLLVLLVWHLAPLPPLPGDDAITMQISQHTGAGILQGLTNRVLIAGHTFLELLHYGVWLLAIPLAARLRRPWEVDEVPLARRSLSWKIGLLAVLGVSALVVVLLWGCFLANYPLTREIYFGLALFHVLAEAPFLLRSL